MNNIFEKYSCRGRIFTRPPYMNSVLCTYDQLFLSHPLTNKTLLKTLLAILNLSLSGCIKLYGGLGDGNSSCLVKKISAFYERKPFWICPFTHSIPPPPHSCHGHSPYLLKNVYTSLRIAVPSSLQCIF